MKPVGAESQFPLMGIARGSEVVVIDWGGARGLDGREAARKAGEGVSPVASLEEFGEVVEARISFS